MSGEELKPYISAISNSFADVARKLDISPQNLDGILKTKDIKTGFIQRLAAAYCVPVSYFFDETPGGKIQHVGEGAQLNEAGASGNINAPGLASLSSSLSSSGDVARLEMELKQAEARIAEKDARIADLKEMISQLLNRG